MYDGQNRSTLSLIASKASANGETVTGSGVSRTFEGTELRISLGVMPFSLWV
jgi:hypothetical protein